MTESKQSPQRVARTQKEKDAIAYRVLLIATIVIAVFFVVVGIAGKCMNPHAFFWWVSFIGTVVAGAASAWGTARGALAQAPYAEILISLAQVLGFWGAALYLLV